MGINEGRVPGLKREISLGDGYAEDCVTIVHQVRWADGASETVMGDRGKLLAFGLGQTLISGDHTDRCIQTRRFG